MLNEWKEFQDYTGAVNYTARNKQDTTYLGRFTFDTILDFEGLNRVLTIVQKMRAASASHHLHKCGCGMS